MWTWLHVRRLAALVAALARLPTQKRLEQAGISHLLLACLELPFERLALRSLLRQLRLELCDTASATS